MLTTNKMMADAISTANDNMINAIPKINAKFGEGFAEQHPELIAGFMITAGIDFNSAWLGNKIEELAEILAASVPDISNEIDERQSFTPNVPNEQLSNSDKAAFVTENMWRLRDDVEEITAAASGLWAGTEHGERVAKSLWDLEQGVYSVLRELVNE